VIPTNSAWDYRKAAYAQAVLGLCYYALRASRVQYKFLYSTRGFETEITGFFCRRRHHHALANDLVASEKEEKKTECTCG